jgi:hypothetical protein
LIVGCPFAGGFGRFSDGFALRGVFAVIGHGDFFR